MESQEYTLQGRGGREGGRRRGVNKNLFHAPPLLRSWYRLSTVVIVVLSGTLVPSQETHLLWLILLEA